MNHRIKHTLWFLLLSITLITGCGQIEQADSDPEEKKQNELTPAEVLAKATEVAEKQSGLSFNTTMDQTMEMESDGMKESLDTTMTMEIETTQDPLAFSMKGSMEMMDESIPMEMYFADMTYYFKDPEANEWGKMEFSEVDKETFEELLHQASSDDPQAMLEQLEPFKNDLTMTHENGTYIITLELDEKQSQKFQDVFIKDQLDEVLSMMDTELLEEEEITNEMDELLDSLKIEHLKQTFYIDEKTFEQKKVDQELIMEITFEGEKIRTDQKMSMDIKGGVDPITIPEEVKTNAVDLGKLEDIDDL